MSITIDEIKEYSGTTTDQNIFLNINTLSIRDVFNYGNFINRTDNPIISSSLVLNGEKDFKEKDGHYFNSIIPYYYFENTPDDGINIYFCIDPLSVEPKGTINFGQINDNKELILKIGKNNNSNINFLIIFIRMVELEYLHIIILY